MKSLFGFIAISLLLVNCGGGGGGLAGGPTESGGSSTPRSGCTMWTGEIDCNNTAGCTWNYSTGMCH